MNDTHMTENSAHRTPAHALERLLFFSDAVFAISITLLVIEIHPPVLKHGASDADFLVSLLNMIPNLIGVIVSFFVIGAFWTGHHRAFDRARHWSPKLLLPNRFLLFGVAGMPFFTAFMSENYGTRVPTVAYCLWLLLVAFLNLWNNSLAVSPPVTADDTDPEYAHLIRRRGWAVILGTLTACVAGAIQPWAAQPALITMPLWRLLLDRLHARQVARPSA